MATFSDVRPISYGEFVQTMPYQEANQLGLYKQQLYDQNLQKIYSGIEQTAALPLSAEVDKQYLQESLNNLQTSLKKLNTADFSQNQVFNSVAGMTAKISKDKYIQAGVMSTMHHQSEMARRQALEKEGKTNLANDDLYDTNWNNYANRKELAKENGAAITFTDEYTPYTDIMKKLRENMTNAGMDSSVLEQMYETNPDGSFKTVNGKLIPARTMTELKKSTNFAQVQAIVENTLRDGNVQQQLRIDGRYNMKNVPVENVISYYQKSYDQKIKQADDEIVLLKTLSTGILNQDKQKENDAKIKQLESNRDKYVKDLKNMKDYAFANPNEFKQDYYAKDYTDNMLQSVLKTERSETNKTSPLRPQLNWENEMSFKQNNEMFDRNIQLRIQAREDAKFGAEHEPDPDRPGFYRKIDYTKKEKEKPVDPNAKMGQTVDGEEQDFITAMQTKLETLSTEKDVQSFNIVYDFYNKTLKGKWSDGRPITRENFKTQIETNAKLNKETTSDYLTRWVLQLNNKANENGVPLSTTDKQNINKFLSLNDEYTNTVAAHTIKLKELEQETGIDINRIKSLNPIEIQVNYDEVTGTYAKKKIKFDYKDALAYNFVLNNNIQIGKTKAEENQYTQYDKMLTEKFGKDYRYVLRPTKAYEMQQQLGKGVSSDYIKKYNQKLSEILNVPYTFTLKVADDKKVRDTQLENLASFNADPKKALAGDNYDQQTVGKALADDKTKIAYIIKAPTKEGQEWTGRAIITQKDGSNITINIDRQSDLEFLTDQKFSPYRYNPLEIRARASPFKSTNLGTYTTDPDAWQSAAIRPNKFPSVQSRNYSILGADVNILPDDTRTITLYLKDKKTGKILKPIETADKYKDMFAAENAISSINDADLEAEVIRTKQKEVIKPKK